MLPPPPPSLLLFLGALATAFFPAGAAAAAAAIMAPTGASLPEVHSLSGEPDFRGVTLRWDYPRFPPRRPLFLVHYCELQAWGPQRCRSKVVTWAEGSDALEEAEAAAEAQLQAEAVRSFAVDVDGLRMATNYSFEVQAAPAHTEAAWVAAAAARRRARAGTTIIVPTKGFSARATQCLPHASEVEVQTGPHFAGRITVEPDGGGGGAEAWPMAQGAWPGPCAVAGDPRSARAAYVLRIDHAACGHVHLNATTVAAHVLVQETLPILTHSTRRFLVLCSYQPETLTVRAGINLPTRGSSDDAIGSNAVEADAVEAMEAVEDAGAVARLQRHRHLVDVAMDETVVQDETAAQLVLMVVVVTTMIAGAVFAAWWLIAKSNRKTTGLSTASSVEPCASLYENFENSLRDTIRSNNTRSDEDATARLSSERENGSDPNAGSSSDSILDVESCSGVFTILTPTPRAIDNEERPCITIAHSSQSEA